MFREISVKSAVPVSLRAAYPVDALKVSLTEAVRHNAALFQQRF